MSRFFSSSGRCFRVVDSSISKRSLRQIDGIHTVKIKKAYIQAEHGVPSDEAFSKAWHGFRKRGIPCELFDSEQIYQRQLPLARDTLVAGGLRVVEGAFRAIDVEVPVADNLPACLARYLGRKVWTSTWGELRRQYAKNGPSEPLFVKPLRQNKGFPAIAVFDAADISATSHLADSQEVLVAEYVVFESEWRCYVCHGQVLELCHYQGEPFCYPDAKVIQNAITDFGRLAPAGYGIDFGVLTDGRTVLVEVNDGYSLGSYGLNSVEYSELLEARWVQLVNGDVG
jgi:hypothetical protein